MNRHVDMNIVKAKASAFMNRVQENASLWIQYYS